MVRLNLIPSLPFGKHRLLITLFHFIAKVRQFANPHLLIKGAVVEFVGTIVCGDTELLERKGLYARLWNLQNRSKEWSLG